MSSSLSPTVITGATGLLGNNIVRHLVAKGVQVIALLREASSLEPLAGLDVEIRYADIRDKERVTQACQGASHIIHCAALVKIGGRDMSRFRAINGGGTRNLVEAAFRENSKLVYVSTSDTVACDSRGIPSDESCGFDTKHATCYSRSKYEGELIVEDACRNGLKATIVNPSFFLGPWDWKPSSGAMLAAVASGKALLAPRGFGCFTDARDVAAATVFAASQGRSGERYLLTGETLSYLDAWKLFADVTGAKSPMGTLPPIVSGIAGSVGDVFGYVTGHEPAVNSTSLNATRCLRLFNRKKAEQELNYAPRPLRVTVEDAWNWMSENSRR